VPEHCCQLQQQQHIEKVVKFIDLIRRSLFNFQLTIVNDIFGILQKKVDFFAAS